MKREPSAEDAERFTAEIRILLQSAWFVLLKDLRVEWRSKEIILTVGYFGFLVVLLFAFAFYRGDAPIETVTAGILWVSVTFSGTLALGRVFERERDNDCITALLLTPMPRPALYLGKTVSVLVFVFLVELIVVPSLIFFFNLPVDFERLAYLAAVLSLGSLGYAIVGTLLAAMLLRSRAKEVLLAIVLYPLVLPLLIAGVKATSALLLPTIAFAELGTWLRIMAVFDIVFGVAALWLFESLVLD